MIITKIEAKEACDWLRAAGFPQYVQLFKDCQLPIDIDCVRSDHEFLDKDAIDSLCRRLNTLNKCVEMKLEMKQSRKASEDSEDEEPCAISTKWSFERRSRRWSRLEGLAFLHGPSAPCLEKAWSEEKAPGDHGVVDEVSSLHSSSGADSDGNGPAKTGPLLETSRNSLAGSPSNKPPSLDSSFFEPPSPGEIPSFSSEESFPEKPPRRRGQSLLRRMERLRFRGSTLKTGSRQKTRPLISQPVLQEGFDEEKLRHLNCVDVLEMQDKLDSQPSSSPASGSSGNSSSPSESSSAVSTPSPVTRVRSHCRRAGPQKQGCARVRADSSEQEYNNDKNRHGSEMFQIPHLNRTGTFPTALTHNILSPMDDSSVNWRTGSFHGYQRSASKDFEPVCSPLATLSNRLSIYDNVPDVSPNAISPEETVEIGEDDVFSALDNVMERINGLQQLVKTWTEKLSDEEDLDSLHDSTPPCPSSPKDIHLEIKAHKVGDPAASQGTPENHDKDPEDLDSAYDDYLQSPLRHKRQRRLHWSSEQSLHLEPPSPGIEDLPVSQINLLHKLSLLKLTALMDKYSPSSRQGWNWTVPKLVRKFKAPDYKGRRVFGVPLLVSVQQTGEPLPRSILQAMEYLRKQCLEQVGLFRKSGVKSRIQLLRDMIEADPDGVSYEGQSAFDVADMVKQYFRDLPESLFTARLSESLLHVYQYFPKDQQLAGAQAAIFLLPDENREALQTLLLFLRDVVECVEENQMTPTNIAVCLAPSLFHLNTLRRESSPTSKTSHRKYSLGRPDQRDLSENLAATQGLAHLVSECPRLFQVPTHWLTQNQDNLNNQALQMEWGQSFVSPTTEDKLEDHIRLELSIQNLLREAREKFRGWASCSTSDHVEVAFRKVDDGGPLRLWKAALEVDASQEEVFHRVLREQKLWQRDLQHSRVIEALDRNLEVYHYVLRGVGSRSPREHVLLRTWQCDPTTGSFVLGALSTEHPDVLREGVRAQVLTCLYLIESVGVGRARLTHFCRTDARGRTPEWYNKVAGHLLSSELVRIRDSFKQDTKQAKE